jgi:tetratricopeptide (TPR) repeat protein
MESIKPREEITASSVFQKRFLLLIIFLVAFSIRFIYLLEIRDNPYFHNLIVDAKTYDEWALTIIGGNDQAAEVYWQAPLYPHFLSLLYRIFSHDYFMVRVIQFFLGALNCVLLYLIAKKFFSPVAVLASLIAALYGPFIFFEGELLAPVILVTLYLLLVLTLLYAVQNQKKVMWFLSGLVNGLAALTHGIAIILIPFISGWIYVRSRKMEKFGTSAARASIFVMGCLLIIGLTTVRNYFVGGEFVPISYNAGFNFYIGNNPDHDYTVGIRPGRHYDELVSQPSKEGITGRSAHSRYFLYRALHFIREEPFTYLKLLCRKIFLFLHGNEIIRNQDAYAFRRFSFLLSGLLWKKVLGFPFGLICPLALMGIVLSIKKREKVSLLYIVLLAHLIGTVMFFVCSRYRIPLIPILIIFASYFLWTIYKNIQSKEYKKLVPYLLIFLFLAVLCNFNVGSMNHEDYPDSYSALAYSYIKRGQMGEAITYLKRAIHLNPDSSYAHFNLGYVYMNSERLDKAVSEFKKALAIDPNDCETHYNLGNVYAKMTKLDEAISEYEQALTFNPNYVDAYRGLGSIYILKGMWEKAIVEFERALTIDKDSAEMYFILGSIYSQRQKLDNALAYYQKAILLKPDMVEAYYSLGILYHDKGMLDEAISMYNRVLAFNPNTPEVINRLGMIYLKKGMLNKAIEQYKKAIIINPSDVKAHNNLGIAYYTTGNYELAIVHYDKALNLGHDVRKEVLQMLEPYR